MKFTMMLTKREVLESFDTLPNKFEAEQAIEKIILPEKIRIGLEESKAGKVVSAPEAKKAEKMVEIVFTEQSLADINDIATYIGIDSVHYASLQVEKFFRRIEIPGSFPQIGRVVPELHVNNVRELIEGNYRIIYKLVNKNTVHILTVHHSGRLIKRTEIVRIAKGK